jgi:general stress protein YciG
MQRNIASMGGQASGGSFEPGETRAREAGHKGGQASGGSFEPGDPRAKEAGRKGGSSRHQPDE